MTQKFRKKPVVIEAEQWFSGREVVGVLEKTYFSRYGDADDGEHIRGLCDDHYWLDGPHVHTLEGPLVVSPGDWIITGVKGERYPVKPDIFAETYEAVDD